MPWDRLYDVWKYVRAYCKSRPQTICMSHSSHFYPQGTNLYFIFIARMEPEEYLEYQAGVIDHIRQAGAALSHHHGIGRMLAPWYEGALGKNELELLRAIKRHLDPNNILDPGGTLALVRGFGVSPINANRGRFPIGKSGTVQISGLKLHVGS